MPTSTPPSSSDSADSGASVDEAARSDISWSDADPSSLYNDPWSSEPSGGQSLAALAEEVARAEEASKSTRASAPGSSDAGARVSAGPEGADPSTDDAQASAGAASDSLLVEMTSWVRRFLDRHASKLWWLHSLYALGLGSFVVMYAQQGFDHARWLTVSLGAGWIVLLLFFRVYGTGERQKLRMAKGTRAKVSFYVMTYVLKNLYQGMLFFLLPFYWRTATLDASTKWFCVLLAILALLSTLDVVFDHYLMRWKTLASIVYYVILFACLNLVIPALLPNTRSLLTLMLAAAVSTVVFWTMHVPLRALTRPTPVIAFMVSVASATGAAYFGRRAIPPVPMHIASGAVGPRVLDDGRLAMHVSRVHESLIQEMHTLTDVITPGGRGDRLYHVWRHQGLEVQRGRVEPSGDPPKGTVRLRSTLRSFNLPTDMTGSWSVDVVTEDDQLVGRVSFVVIR